MVKKAQYFYVFGFTILAISYSLFLFIRLIEYHKNPFDFSWKKTVAEKVELVNRYFDLKNNYLELYVILVPFTYDNLKVEPFYINEDTREFRLDETSDRVFHYLGIEAYYINKPTGRKYLNFEQLIFVAKIKEKSGYNDACILLPKESNINQSCSDLQKQIGFTDDEWVKFRPPIFPTKFIFVGIIIFMFILLIYSMIYWFSYGLFFIYKKIRLSI